MIFVGALFGQTGVIVFIGVLMLGLIIYLLSILVNAVRKKYKEYELAKEVEAEKIIRKLKNI